MMELFKASLLFPLISAVGCAVVIPSSKFAPRAAIFASLCLTFSALCALAALFMFGNNPQEEILWTWMQSGDFSVHWAIYVDKLSVVMVAMVSLISCLIHIYSIAYMAQDKSIARFFCYLSLFTFSMMLLVSASNLLMLFVGWEGVGLCSYLLIGFWIEKRTAANAALKAFIYNRVGDSFFVLGMIALAVSAMSLDLKDILALSSASEHPSVVLFQVSFPLLPLAGGFLLMGAMAKSAQLFLHGWLPDAMEGPTPVSALIHAATMVTAGIVLILRLAPLFDQEILQDIIVMVGGMTALFASMNAVAQRDIKRLIAWSTCSQIGYMMLALGVAAWGAAFFHLITHAFFKALLFLAAGSVIHALNGEQDLRRMANLYKKMPVTTIAMFIGVAALAGAPFLSGFYSKEAILEEAFLAGRPLALWAWAMGLIAACLTAIYAVRLAFIPFFKKGTTAHEPHEAPLLMNVPMMLLALGAIFLGALTHDYFIESSSHHAPALIKYLPLFIALAGMMLSFLFILFEHKPLLLRLTHSAFASFMRHGWYMDRLYHRLFVRPIKNISHSCASMVEAELIDALGPDGIARSVGMSGALLMRAQRGSIARYGLFLILLFILILTWYALRVIAS